MTNGTTDQSPPESTSLTVFDDYIESSSTAANVTLTALTNPAQDDALGFYDQLALQVIVDDTKVGTAPAALTVQIAHSADGRNYVYKNASPEVSTPAQLNLGTPTYMSFGYDGGVYPSLGMVRLVIVLTAAVGPVSAHVRVTVTGNNLNEQAFTQTVMKEMNAQAAGSKTYVLEYGSGQKIETSTIAELVQFINDVQPFTDDQLHQQEKDAHDALANPSGKSKTDVATAQTFLLWEPILLLKNAGRFNHPSVTVPAGFTIAFLGDGHYLLLKGSAGLWESSRPSKGLFARTEYASGLPRPHAAGASAGTPSISKGK